MFAPRTSSLLVLAIVTLGSLRCGADDGSTGTLTLKEYVRGVAETLCAERTRCLAPQASAECEPVATAVYAAAQLPLFEAEVASGELVYNGAKAQACLDSLVDPTCSFERFRSELDAACPGLFVGQVPEGGACRDHMVCAGRPATYCDTSASCPGICAVKLAAGEPCSYGSVCADGLVCGDGGCQASVGAGPGEACDLNDGPRCNGLLQCAETSDGTGSICRSYAEISTADVGESCNPTSALCRPGLACAYGDGPFTCVEPVAADQPCTAASPSMCPAGYECVGATMNARTCVPLPVVGDACEHDCEWPALCIDGTCAEALENGAACEQEAQCLSGACTNGVCAAWDLCANDK